MKLEFSGSPEINATRERVWSRLTDPDFVAASAPGVERVEAIDPTHFKVISGLGFGTVRVRFTLDVELFDIIDRESLKMRAIGNAPGSEINVVSSLRIADDGPGNVRLEWSATSEVGGTMAKVGGPLITSAARRLTEEFWTDFARRAGAG
jgi:carbon monoxide dehydrogenase subunit G